MSFLVGNPCYFFKFRVTPKQKEVLAVLLTKYKPHKTILSIGDGTNDVSM
jgi:magnesium-transporting ATPase (P-type)